MTGIYGRIFSKKPLSESHKKIIDLVGSSKQVLELGSSTGYLTREFKKNGCAVDIIEKDADDIKKAKAYARKAFLGSLEDDIFLNNVTLKYDFVVAADVIEHLKDPEKILNFIKKHLKRKAGAIISLPNIATWQIRKNLFFRGQFDYQEEGILDKTHLRFFTYFTLQNLLKTLGFKILNIYQMETDYPFKRTILSLSVLGWFLDKTVGTYLIKKFPNLCAGHIIIEARVND